MATAWVVILLVTLFWSMLAGIGITCSPSGPTRVRLTKPLKFFGNNYSTRIISHFTFWPCLKDHIFSANIVKSKFVNTNIFKTFFNTNKIQQSQIFQKKCVKNTKNIVLKKLVLKEF